MAQALKYVQGDTQPALRLTFTGAVTDLSTHQSIRLHIAYRPWPVVIDFTDVDAEHGVIEFSFAKEAETSLAAGASAAATSIEISSSDYAALPTSGVIEIGADETRELVRYASKTAPDLLNLTDALEFDHVAGERVFKLPDLRAGKWAGEVQLVDEDGDITTENGFLFDVSPEIA